MLATFNPNSNVISKKIIQMASWKQLAKQSPKDYLKLETSKVYDSFNGGKGCTLAIKNKDGSIFNPWCIVAEAKYAYVNGNFAPLSTGPYAANNCNENAERSLDVILGDITERLQSHLLEQGWSEKGIKKLIADQIEWKTWFESVLDWASDQATSMVVGKKRKETKAFIKDNGVNDGVLNTLFKNTKEKDDINTVKLTKIKGREVKNAKDSNKEIIDNQYKFAAKCKVMNYGAPAYPLISDHRDRELEPISLVPSQETINKIYTKNSDGTYAYNQFDEETGEMLDPTLIRSSDLVKMCFRPTFYKSSDGIGFTMKLKEVILIARPPNNKKRSRESSYNSGSTQSELNEYF